MENKKETERFCIHDYHYIYTTYFTTKVVWCLRRYLSYINEMRSTARDVLLLMYHVIIITRAIRKRRNKIMM